MHPDESTPLMPEAGSLNWRQQCCNVFSCGCLWGIVYSLLLLADVAGSIYLYVVPVTLFHLRDVGCMFLNGIDTLICLIFLTIVARSPRFVSHCTRLKNLRRLPRFWTLVFLLLLYISGALLLVISSPDLRNPMYIGCLVTAFLNALTKVALVGTLNHVQVGHVVRGRSRFECWLLKRTLFATWICLILSMIGAILTFYRSFSIVVDENNSRGQRQLTLTMTVMNVLMLPFVAKTTDLIWTKILQDDKCIIGKYKRNSSTRQNSRISYAIEII